MRIVVVAACLVLVVAGCGGGELTLTEYAEQVEESTTALYRTLDELTLDVAFEAPTVEDVQDVYGGAATAFNRLHEGLEAIDPPADVDELHTAALALAADLAVAGDAFARLTEDVESEDEMGRLFSSPEALAFDAAQDKIVTFCLDRQAEFDATADRERFADTPWIPPDMQEVVLVAFGCEAQGSGGD